MDFKPPLITLARRTMGHKPLRFMWLRPEMRMPSELTSFDPLRIHIQNSSSRAFIRPIVR